MVGEKGLEPSPLARPVPKTGASTSSAIAPTIDTEVIDIIFSISTPFYYCDQLKKILQLF